MEDLGTRFRDEFHWIETPGITLLFHVPTFTLLKSNPSLKDELKTDGSNSTDGNSASDTLTALFHAVDERPRPSPSTGGLHLMLLVTQTCNLNCPYCYALGGDYGHAAIHMKPADVPYLLDTFRSKVGEISSLTFFGGEPSLNLETVAAVCQYFEAKQQAQEIAGPPAYIMTTNGTNVTPQLTDLINQHRITCSVSIDGPEQVTARTRITKGRKSAFSEIVEGIRHLQSDTNVPVTYEATYTRYHQEAGLSFTDLMDYFRDDLQLTTGIISAYAGPPSDPLAPVGIDRLHNLNDLTERTFQELVNSDTPLAPDSVMDTIDLIVRPTVCQYVCPLGVSHFALTPTGDVYPCQMYISAGEPFLMGNVHDQDFGPASERWNAVLATFKGINKAMSPKCQKCWVRNICHGCPGAQFLATGVTAPMDNQFCGTRKAHIEKTLVLLYKARQDPALWRRLVDNMKKLGHQREC